MDDVKTGAGAASYQDLAGLIEYSLIATHLSEQDVARRCEAAVHLGVATVMVRPSDVDLAARWIGSSLRLSSVVDVPFGYSTTAAKTFAARDLLRRGVKEIDTVMNTGKLMSRQFQYLETELLQMAEASNEAGALLKIHLESEYLDDELKMVACRIARRAGAHYIATSILENLPLLREHSRGRLELKCAADITSLETALAWRDAGCTRMESADPAPILEAWKARLAEMQNSAAASE